MGDATCFPFRDRIAQFPFIIVPVSVIQFPGLDSIHRQPPIPESGHIFHFNQVPATIVSCLEVSSLSELRGINAVFQKNGAGQISGEILDDSGVNRLAQQEKRYYRIQVARKRDYFQYAINLKSPGNK